MITERAQGVIDVKRGNEVEKNAGDHRQSVNEKKKTRLYTAARHTHQMRTVGVREAICFLSSSRTLQLVHFVVARLKLFWPIARTECGRSSSAVYFHLGSFNP